MVKKWYLNDIDKIDKNGITVFTTFSCGGGSSMGYKLAGCDVIGNVEIDEKMNDIYKLNHDPLFNFKMDIRKFNDIPNDELPKELFNLDILDGSPPCSSFSMAGSRDKGWSKKKKFREGQEVQTLDDLFFNFIETAKKLQPKIVIAENVKGLIQGKSKGYVRDIIKKFDEAGYTTQLFLFNAATMGVPQARERVFFVCTRKDLNYPKVQMKFKKKPITFNEVEKNIISAIGKPITQSIRKWYFQTPTGRGLDYSHPKGSFFNYHRCDRNRVVPTITASGANLLHPSEPNIVSDEFIKVASTFPSDFNFNGQEVSYVCGMSVPPIMMKQVAKSVIDQLLVSGGKNR